MVSEREQRIVNCPPSVACLADSETSGSVVNRPLITSGTFSHDNVSRLDSTSDRSGSISASNECPEQSTKGLLNLDVGDLQQTTICLDMANLLKIDGNPLASSVLSEVSNSSRYVENSNSNLCALTDDIRGGTLSTEDHENLKSALQFTYLRSVLQSAAALNGAASFRDSLLSSSSAFFTR